MNPLEVYLQRVANELRSMPVAKREDELRELRLHLEQRVEDFIAQGLSTQQAQSETLEEFGAPRALGTQLRQAWEEQTISSRYFVRTLTVVIALWLYAPLVLLVARNLLPFWPPIVLVPELPYILWALAISVPFLCGWWLFHNLRRSALWVTPLLFGSLHLAFAAGFDFVTTNLFPTTTLFYHLTLIFNTALALSGTFTCYAVQGGNSDLLLTSGQVVTPTTPRASIRKAVLLLLLGVSALWGLRVYIALYPQSATSVVRDSFLIEHNPPLSSFQFSPPEIIALQELTPVTLAERQGREKRVYFRVKAHLDEDSARFHVMWLQHELSNPAAHTPAGRKQLRRYMAQLQKDNSHIVEGVVRLKRSSASWTVDENSFVRARLWNWFWLKTDMSRKLGLA